MSTGKATDSRHEQGMPEVIPNTINGQKDSTDHSGEKILEKGLDSGRRISPYRTTKTAKEFWRHIWNGLTLGYLRD